MKTVPRTHPLGPAARVVAGLAGLLLCEATPARDRTRIEIVPGPVVQSEAELALVADPAQGIVDGVILVEETTLDDDLGTEMETRYHRRAKILSNAGRELGDVQFFISEDNTRVRDWWGRTILPDGRVLELRQEELSRQFVVGSRHGAVHAMRASLPGITPGCVVDYGYTLRETGMDRFRHIPIQSRWTVREWRYRWKPWKYLPGSFHLNRALTLGVESVQDKDAVLWAARNIPAVVEEPLMPPSYQLTGSLTLYYATAEGVQEYWPERGKEIERRVVKGRVGKARLLRDALAGMELPAEADLSKKVRIAYQWIGRHLRSDDTKTVEELEEEEGEEEETRARGIERLLQTREGSASDIDLLFIGLVRTLGAQAHLVLAADRTQNFWDPGLRSMDQFHGWLVAVHMPGEPEGRLTVVDPGSGLPYGQIPWRYTGIKAFLIDEKGGREISLPPSEAARNLSESRVTIRFPGDMARQVVSWTENAQGQAGIDRQMALRGIEPDSRQEMLEGMCGSGPGAEVRRAEVAEPDALLASLRLTCEVALSTEIDDGQVGTLDMTWDGPWVQDLPDLPEGPRVHPVLFDFPRVGMATISIEAPPGFVPRGAAPADVELQCDFGRYKRKVSFSTGGARIERALALTALGVPAGRYPEFTDFLRRVRAADEEPIRFQRGEIVP